MKLSIVCGLNESKNSQEEIIEKFSRRCELLDSLKYDGIELSVLEPEKIDIKQINDIKDSYNFQIPAIGTGGTFLRFGYSLGHQNEKIREIAIQRIEKYIKFAQGIQSKVIIGLIRGRFNFESSSKKEKKYIKISLKECCRLAEKFGVKLLFEPINRFEIDSYNTISESVKLVEEIASNNLSLLIDSYHTHLEEDPGYIWDYLKEITNYVGHIHLADCTRRAPGTGHFDFKTFLNIFNNAGYTDFISVETIMKPSFEEVARESSEYLRFILKR